MPGFPDSYSATLADAALGSTREADRQADAAEVRRLLDQMQEIADELRSIGVVPWQPVFDIEAAMAVLRRAL